MRDVYRELADKLQQMWVPSTIEYQHTAFCRPTISVKLELSTELAAELLDLINAGEQSLIEKAHRQNNVSINDAYTAYRLILELSK